MVPRVAEASAAPFARCLLPCPAGALSRPGSLVRDLVSPALSRRRSQPAWVVGQGSGVSCLVPPALSAGPGRWSGIWCLLPCPAGALSRPGSLVRDLVSPALSRRRSQPARIVGQGSEQLSDDRFAGATGLPVEPED